MTPLRLWNRFSAIDKELIQQECVFPRSSTFRKLGRSVSNVQLRLMESEL